jgi:subtilisin family serine protease
MNKGRICGVVMLVMWLGFVGVAIADSGPAEAEMRINVGLTDSRAGQNVVTVVKHHGGKLLLEIPQLNTLTFSVPKSAFLSIRDQLQFAQLAEFVEEDLERHIALREIIEIGPPEIAGGIAHTPDDPSYSIQWGPACIGAEDLWDLGFGNPSVIVAVVDTGVDMDHPDLVNNVDPALDWDFVNNDDNAMDDHGHGTHVAGIIAAEINNQKGIAGLQQATIMAVKGLDAGGYGNDSVLANCITYAVDNGASVINCSWGGYGYNSTLKNAVDYAFANGVIVIAAAGNEGTSLAFYPAAYPYAIGVAALSNCTTRAFWSNYGINNVLIAAPGESILSTYWDDTYAYLSGTSMAAPHVAGVVAAYRSLAPSWSHIRILRHMAVNADDLGTPGVDQYYGYGRVDMYPMD